MQKYLLVAFGGALGSAARFWVGGWATGRLNHRFFYGTFIINVTACLLIGLVMELFASHGWMDSPWRYLVPIGFLGGYSTFSSFEWEIFSSLSVHALGLAVGYAACSLFFGLLAVWAGVWLGRAIG